MSRTFQIIADLTLENEQGDIRLNNTAEGDLKIEFPNEETLFSLLGAEGPIPSDWRTLFRVNRLFYRNRQTVRIKVNDRPWVILGRSFYPRVSNLSVLPRYISRTTDLKPVLYSLGVGLGLALIFALIRKRN